MKKIYFSLFALSMVGSTFAQSGISQHITRKDASFDSKVKESNHAAPKGATLWSDDFSTPSNWSMDNTSVPFADWFITTDVNAIPVTALNPAGHTTAANGYALIDSDALGETANQNCNITTATPIDMTGTTNISLVFEHSYRTYLDTRIVRVSGDGGSTWTDYVITDGSGANTNTANPEVASINISAVAAGSANVLVQFNYQGNWGWYWAVDDVKIVETNNIDLSLDKAIWGVDGPWGERMPYYQTPTAQVQPINFCGISTNQGINDVADGVYAASINGGTTILTTAPFALLSSATDTFCTSMPYTPAATPAAFTVDHVVTTSGDEDLTNNAVAQTSFAVTDFIYARDAQVMTSGSYNSGQEFEVGNVFDIFQDATATAVDVYIHPGSNVGAEIRAKLYYVDPGTGDFIYIDESAAYYLTAADLGGKVILPFFTPQLLTTATGSYIAVVHTYGDGGLTDDLIVGTSGTSAPQTTFYYNGTDLTWYYSTSTPMVRLNFDPNPTAGLSTLAEGKVGVYPNPAVNSTKVVFNAAAGADVNITVTDLTGKSVYANNLGKVNAGTNSVSINTESFNNGIYFVNVTTNGVVSTTKLVVKK